MQALIKIQANSKEVLNHAYSHFLHHPSVHPHHTETDSFCVVDMDEVDKYLKDYVDEYAYADEKKTYNLISLKVVKVQEIVYEFPNEVYQTIYELFRGLKLDFAMEVTSATIAVKYKSKEDYYDFLHELSCQVEDTLSSKYPDVWAEPCDEFGYQVFLGTAVPKTKLKVLEYCRDSRKWGLNVWANQHNSTFDPDNSILECIYNSDIEDSLSKALGCKVTRVHNTLILTELSGVSKETKYDIMLDAILSQVPPQYREGLGMLVQDIYHAF